jgi:hypothetical protein
MKYTRADDVIARELVAAGADDNEFRRVMGRTKAAVVAHLAWIDNPDLRGRHSQRNAARRREKPKSNVRISAPVAVPEDRRADAERRLLAPRSLTAMLFGDPAPGQSALDRCSEVRA